MRNQVSELHQLATPQFSFLTLGQLAEEESNRADALRNLAVKLPPDLLPETLAAAREIHDERDRVKALRSLADQLPELLPEALAAAREIQSEFSRADALSALADKLSQIQKTELFSHWRDTLHILSLPNLKIQKSAHSLQLR